MAAGTSSRLGIAKQLIEYNSKTLLENAVEKALSISDNVFVVLGKYKDACQRALSNYSVNYVINENYGQGLSSSIKEGIKSLDSFENVLIMLSDQPLIPEEHLHKIVTQAETKNKIICSLYNKKYAVPALFPKRYFPLLSKIEGDKGAKNIILEHEHTYLILKDELALDIDTKEDLEKLNNYTN